MVRFSSTGKAYVEHTVVLTTSIGAGIPGPHYSNIPTRKEKTSDQTQQNQNKFAQEFQKEDPQGIAYTPRH